MKTILNSFLILLLSTLASCQKVNAQTNTNSSPLTTAGQFLLGFLSDNQSYFGTNNNVRADLWYLETGSHAGGAIDLHLPLLTNGQVSAGAAVAYIGDQLYDAALNVNLGMTLKPLSVFGVATNFAVFTWIESGPDIRLSDNSIGSQTFGGVTWNTHLGSGCLSLQGMAGNISQLQKKVWGFGLGYSFHPNGW